jgi:hypothetical protein
MRPGQRANLRSQYSAKQIAAAELRLQQNQDRKEQVRDLWNNLQSYVKERGGQITTKPYAWPAQLEVFPESELPAKLKGLGWALVERGQITRIGPPQTRWNASPFRTMYVYDVILPGGR